METDKFLSVIHLKCNYQLNFLSPSAYLFGALWGRGSHCLKLYQVTAQDDHQSKYYVFSYLPDWQNNFVEQKYPFLHVLN